LARLERRLDESAPRPRLGSKPFVFALAAAVVLGAIFLVTRQAAPVVRMAGSSDRVPTGVWLGAPEGNKLPLEFSDGTEVELSSASEARILSLTSSAQEMELRRGRARFHVTKRDGSSFAVRAGPYTVRVTGTRFDVTWTPVDDMFVVELHEGQVTLEGCGFGKGRQLAAGQTTRARCDGGRVSVGYEDTEQPGSPSTSAVGKEKPERSARPEPEASGEQAAVSELAAPPAGASASGSGQPEHVGANWKELSKRGAHKEALASVEASGFEREASRATARELVQLADSAQHAGALGRARRALQLLRQRFAGSEEAAFATFALGRLEFDGFGAHAQAARWFRTYLREQPQGPFAREALGRLMESLHRGGEAREARRLAQNYLRRYPSGPHAALASRLTSRP
jgi:ferric-dicitrate binding protein FerR (iron transport regulator)